MFGWHVPAPDEAMLISGKLHTENGLPFKIVTGHGAFVVAHPEPGQHPHAGHAGVRGGRGVRHQTGDRPPVPLGHRLQGR